MNNLVRNTVGRLWVLSDFIHWELTRVRRHVGFKRFNILLCAGMLVLSDFMD